MNPFLRAGKALVLCFTAVFFAAPSVASVIINATRVIYNADAREVTLKLDNTGSVPSIVQMWTDRGDSKQTPDSADAPFVITPPIARIAPGKSQTLRISFTGETIPADRESLFYFNMLELPASKKTPADVSALKFSFRSRLKLFLRPAGLKSVRDVEANAPKWRIIRAAGEGSWRLECTNPSPYHISISEISLKLSGASTPVQPEMLRPLTTEFFPIPAGFTPSGPAEVEYSTISDFGATVGGRASAPLVN